jgi:hypothetical protein
VKDLLDRIKRLEEKVDSLLEFKDASIQSIENSKKGWINVEELNRKRARFEFDKKLARGEFKIIIDDIAKNGN